MNEIILGQLLITIMRLPQQVIMKQVNWFLEKDLFVDKMIDQNWDQLKN